VPLANPEQQEKTEKQADPEMLEIREIVETQVHKEQQASPESRELREPLAPTD